MAIQVQEFNGDILVDGNVTSESIKAQTATVTGAMSAQGILNVSGTLTAESNIVASGTITGAYLNSTGNATNQAMSQKAITDAINNAISSTLLRAHPVGEIYTSAVSTSPASLFGGTWEQLTADAYLKIVTAGAGNTDGTSPSHRIPLECMPSHTHDIYNMQRTSSIFLDGRDNFVWRAEVGASNSTSSTGGNAPYRPWYYGIYAWRRIS